jgi:hypothetical protein
MLPVFITRLPESASCIVGSSPMPPEARIFTSLCFIVNNYQLQQQYIGVFVYMPEVL